MTAEELEEWRVNPLKHAFDHGVEILDHLRSGVELRSYMWGEGYPIYIIGSGPHNPQYMTCVTIGKTADDVYFKVSESRFKLRETLERLSL